MSHALCRAARACPAAAFGGALPSPGSGNGVVLAIGAGAAVLALFLAAALIRRRRTRAGEAAAPDGAVAESSTGAAGEREGREREPGERESGERESGERESGVREPGERDSDERELGAAVAVPLARAVAELVTAVPGLSAEEPSTGGTPVRGRVRCAGSAPVTGAALTLISLEGRQLGRSATDGDGAYHLTAPGPGTYVLIAAADGRLPQATTLVVGDSPIARDVVLDSVNGLTGTVRSAASGTPLAGAVVSVTDGRGELLATERTDEQGEFTVTGLAPGAVTLSVTAPGHRPVALAAETAGSGMTRLDVELRSGVPVRGTVRGAGVPLGHARVTLVDAAGTVVATTTTGSDGAYAFADVDHGAYTVIATGYPPRASGVSVDGSGVAAHDIELARASRGD
ncbi:collagen binding domain-containing protein [Streptomyces sp. MS06]|uniref:MSCRAMM family protein n=1 Tax=Streptomyces sp. MS06 TaxID=3385974 RepID=UPI0039A109EF